MTGVAKQFWEQEEGTSVRAWLKHFDQDNNGKIEFEEFCIGMQKLNFSGDVVALWNDIDADGSGELTLDEIDAESADTFMSFRRWCCHLFAGSKDMVTTMAGGGGGGRAVSHEAFQSFVQR